MSDPAENVDLPPGTVLGDRFHVRALLGHGGMGAVYAAWDAQSERDVALKLMRDRFRMDARAQERFRREGELLARIRHPGIVSSYESGTLPDGTPFMVLELLHGETLAARIEREAPLPAASLVPFVDEVCSALGAAHTQGLVHRDIKPSNLFLVKSSRGPGVRLLDFGVAMPVDRERLTSTGVVVGTVLYMAPEHLAGEPLDGRADIYSLGVVLHEALTGRHPFSAVDEEHLATGILVGRARAIAGVSPEVAAVVGRAMARVRSQRFATAAELAVAFRDAVLRSETSPAVPAGGQPLPSPDAQRGLPASPYDPTVPAGPRALPAAPKQKRPRRVIALLAVPLLVMCAVTGLGAVSCNACGGMITDQEMQQLAIRLRPSFATSPKGAEYERDFAELERLHAAGETSIWTVSLLDTELEDGLRDGELDEAELAFVMSRVREAVDRGGQYGVSRFFEIIAEDAERDRDRRRVLELEEAKHE